jgi:DNA-binding GntR family transcriptional regulator
VSSSDIGRDAERPYATKSDFAYRRLRRAILCGEYAPGAPLNQALLAQTIGISTTPLREALRRLSSEGLVELESHRDARVTELTAEESRDLLEMRLALDPLAISLAADRRSRDDIRRMRAAREEMDSKPCGTAVVDPEAHREFHAAMYRASHNELLISTLDSLWDKAERYRLLGMKAVRWEGGDVLVKRQRKAADHAAILDCIIRGDGDQGAELMRRHIAKSLEARAATSLSEGTLPIDTDGTIDPAVASDA